MERQPGSKRLRKRWVVGSLILHAALFGSASQQRVSAPLQLAQRAAADSRELEIDFEIAEPAPAPEAEPVPETALRARPRSGNPHPAPSIADSAVPPGGRDDDLSTQDATDATAVRNESDATTGAGTAGDDGPLGPRLSLTELGVGEGNPFVERPSTQQKKAAKARAVKRRLDRALAQGLLDHDSARGHGAGSPVMRILEAATYASTTPANSNASFTFVIDSEGKVVSGSLGATSSDREAWERVARQAVRDLAGHKLRVPKGSGVKLTVQVTSRLELPSGADPGVEVRAFGVPLKRGEGDRSTRVDILNPLNPLAPLSLMGDPADIGAKARRMVRSHVTSEELL